MSEEEMPGYLRLIAPPVGSIWEWEPLKSYARCLLRVTNVTWDGTECHVEAIKQVRNVYFTDDPSARPLSNELSRWVQATVLVESPNLP